jgi:TRAP-type C4-dicarboxylate transport system permease small subunit
MKRSMGIFANKIDALIEKIKIFPAFCVILLVIFLATNVVLRYFFEKPLVFTEEITGYLLAFIVFMGLGYTLKAGGHVITDIFVSRLSVEKKRVIKVPIIIGGIIFSAFLTASAGRLVVKNFARKAIDFGSLGTPEWIPNIIFFVGTVFFLLQMVCLLLRSKD